MDSQELKNAVLKYFDEVTGAFSIGNVESSYNAPIIELFTKFGCAARDMSGERKGQSGENIDIKLWHDVESVTEIVPFAGIEVKKVGGIDKRALAQIKVEAERYGNAILTDNAEWRFFRSGDTGMYTGLKIFELKEGSLVLKEESIDLFINLVEDFLLTSPTRIKSSQKLAEYMAMHARTIRSIVLGILKEDKNGQPIISEHQANVPMFPELCGLFKRLKSDIRLTMNVHEFADMYAQTIVYGFFIARYNDTSYESFDRFEAIQYLQEESELLKQFFVHIIGPGKKHPTLEGVLDKLCNLYSVCDISALLDLNEKRDTIVHFYEDFLTYYDPQLRKDLGVFYTPVEAVDYLVSMVDSLLIKEFGIEDGISNNDEIRIKVPCAPYKEKRKTISEKEIDVPRVAILDPACGTGTFGAEIIRFIKNKYFTGGREAFYEDYIQTKNGLLSRLIGFEIMMTSYVVAHLKIRRTITETLGKKPDEHVPTKIFLTNTLAPPLSSLERNDQLSIFDLYDFSAAITEEAYSADTWKARRPVKVIIGNPPYLASSTNPYDISSYKKETDGITDFGERKHWLNDDYVKFFRFAEQIISRNNEGILAYVSNNGYLDNHTFRGMRGSLLRTFDKIYIVNLHGSANKKETTPDGNRDENIFNIMQGVSLFIGVKTSRCEKWADVYHADLWGTRDSKLAKLMKGDIEFQKLSLDRKMAYFVPFGDEKKDAYDKGIEINKLFPVNVTGIVSGNDKAALAPTKSELQRRMDIVRNSNDDATVAELWGGFSRGQSADSIRDDVLSDGVVTPIAYRPFDLRWTYYTGKSCGWILWPREKRTMGHLLTKPTSPVGKNIGIVFCKTSRSFLSPFIAENIIASRLFSAMCEIAYIAPLYLYSDSQIFEKKWSANIDDSMYDKLTEKMRNKPSPLEIFDYVYGVLHDPVYIECFEQYLYRDFPRVPIINSAEKDSPFVVTEEMFKEYVRVGSELRQLHLLQTKSPMNLTLHPNNADNLLIEQVKYANGVVKINTEKSISVIPKEVWDYQIGGHKVIDKWLKERKDKSLTMSDFSHIEIMVGAISKTIELEQRLKSMH